MAGLRERIAKYKKLSVALFATKHRLQPQLVHYYIRKGEIQKYYCDCCGADVIDVEEAEAVFRRIGKIK